MASTNSNTNVNVTEAGSHVVYKARNVESKDDAKIRVRLFPVSDGTFTATIQVSDPDAGEWVTLKAAPGGADVSFTAADSVVIDAPSDVDIRVNVSAVTGTVRVGAFRAGS